MYLMQTVSATPRGRPASSADLRHGTDKHCPSLNFIAPAHERVPVENGFKPCEKKNSEIENEEEREKKKDKKWSIGGFFRRKSRKDSDDSSEGEGETKKGFLSRKRSNRKKRKSTTNGFDVVVPKFHSADNVGKTAEELWSGPTERQQRYIFRHHDIKIDANLTRTSSGGSGSLDSRKGRREVLARAQAKRDQMRDGSSSDDNESGHSSSSVTREGRRRRPGRSKVPSATPSPSRSPRVQPKQPLHSSSSYPLPIHTYPPGYHWEHLNNRNNYRQTIQEYEHFIAACGGSRNKSMSYDQDMHRAEAMFVQLPIARTRSSCIQTESHGEVPNLKPDPPPRTVNSRVDSTSSLPVQPHNHIQRSSSGHAYSNFYENISDPFKTRASSFQQIYQNYANPNNVTKARVQYTQSAPKPTYYWGNGNYPQFPTSPQAELRYYADQNPRSRNPIHITCTNTNPSPVFDPTYLSDSQVSRKTTKEFWQRKDQEQIRMQQKASLTKTDRSRSNSPALNSVSHKPKQGQSAVVVARKVVHGVPDKKDQVNPSPIPIRAQDNSSGAKSPPNPPVRNATRLEPNSNSMDAENSSNNLDDALNELETIYKSLRLGEDIGGTPVKKPQPPKTTPDKIADDMAVRRLTSGKESSDNKSFVQQSYLQCSPVLTLSPRHSPVPPRNQSSTEPDITLDDVVFRNIRHANSSLKITDPQPPFGIPVGPVAPSPISDYLHVSPKEKIRPSFLSSKTPDVIKDDLAYRNLRKDNGHNKKKAVRSMSENLFNILQKEGNSFMTIESNNNIISGDISKTHSMTDINENIKKDIGILEKRLKALKEEKVAKRAEFFEDSPKSLTPTWTDRWRSSGIVDNGRQMSTSTETLTEESEARKLKEKSQSLFNDSIKQPPPTPERRHFKSPVVELSKYPAAVPAAALYSNPFKEQQSPLDESQLDDLLSTIAREAKNTSEAIGRQLVELEVAVTCDMLSPDRKNSKLRLSSSDLPKKTGATNTNEISCSSSSKRMSLNKQVSSQGLDGVAVDTENAIHTSNQLQQSETLPVIKVNSHSRSPSIVNNSDAKQVATSTFRDVKSSISSLKEKCEKLMNEDSRRNADRGSPNVSESVGFPLITLNSHSRSPSSSHTIDTGNSSNACVDNMQTLKTDTFKTIDESDPEIPIEVKLKINCVKDSHTELTSLSQNGVPLHIHVTDPLTTKPLSHSSGSPPNFETISDLSELIDNEENELFVQADEKVDVFEEVYEYNRTLADTSSTDQCDISNGIDNFVEGEIKRTGRPGDDRENSETRRERGITPLSYRGECSGLPRGSAPGGSDSWSDVTMNSGRRSQEVSSTGSSGSDGDRARERIERYKDRRRQELLAKYGAKKGPVDEPQPPSSSSSSRWSTRQKTDTAAAVISKKTETSGPESRQTGRDSAERELLNSSSGSWGVRETRASRLRAASHANGKSENEKTVPFSVRKESADKSQLRKSPLNRPNVHETSKNDSQLPGGSGVRRKSSASLPINGHTAMTDQTSTNNNEPERRTGRAMVNGITKQVSLDDRTSTQRAKKIISEPPSVISEPLETQQPTKPSILKKKSVDEPPTADDHSPRPVSILKRKTLSQEGAVTFSPSVIERERNSKKQGILKKRRSLDESEVARRRNSSPEKSILKTQRRSSLEELTSILKRDSTENIHEPQGILKRKTSSPGPPAQHHISIADNVIMAAAAALGDLQQNGGMRPILKKKVSSEEHTPEQSSAEPPRPILKKKSVDGDDHSFVKPILKSSRKSSSEELPSGPILKRADTDEGSSSHYEGSSVRSHERARSAPPSRPLSSNDWGSQLEDSHPKDTRELSSSSSSASQTSTLEFESQGCSSKMSSPQGLQVDDEAVLSAKSKEVNSGSDKKDEDLAEDELSNLSLSDRVRLFNSKIKSAEPLKPPMIRRSRSTRFKTQPVTDEERNEAQDLRAQPSSNGSLHEFSLTQSLPPTNLRGILKRTPTTSESVDDSSENSFKPKSDAEHGVKSSKRPPNGLPPLQLKLCDPTNGDRHPPCVVGAGDQLSNICNLAKVLQSVSQEARTGSSLVKSQSHSAVASVYQKAPQSVVTNERIRDSECDVDESKAISGLRRSTTQPLGQLNEDDDMSGLSIKERLAKLRQSGEVSWQKRKTKMKSHDEVSVVATGNYLFNGNTDTDSSSASVLATRLNQLDTARESWKTRVPLSDALQFTVEGKMGAPSQLTTPVTPVGDRSKRSPKQIRFRSKNYAPLLQSTPASPATTPHITRSLSAPEEPAAQEADDDVTIGPSVAVPRADDETFTSFFQSVTSMTTSDRFQIRDEDLDALQRNDDSLLVRRRTIQVQRRRRTVRNPVKSLALREDLQDEYIEIKTGVAERELKRLRIEKFCRGSNFAVEALAGLASTENFTAIHLKKPIAGPVQYPDVMLLKIKGRRHVQTRLVEPESKSVNSGDCFILVTRSNAAMYLGEFANVVERARAKEIASRIEAGELACSAGYVQGEHKFWSILGGENSSAAGPPDEDEKVEAALVATNMTYELSNHELIPLTSAWGTVPKVDILQPNKNLIFDFGSEMYVWSGKLSSIADRREAASLARELWDEGFDYTDCDISPVGEAQNSDRPPWALFCKVTQNMEPVLFREKFQDWPDEALLNRHLPGFSETDGSSMMDIEACDVSRMLKERPPWPDLELEGSHLGRGESYFDEDTRRVSEVTTLQVTTLKVGEHEEITDSRSLGQFFEDASYVVRWHYSVTLTVRQLNGEPSRRIAPGRDRYAYFLWQGRHSTPGDCGAGALLTVSLDSESAPQIVVPQFMESPAFMQLFDGALTIHTRKERDVSLYIVRGVVAKETVLIEVDPSFSSLRSQACFIVVDRKNALIILWVGCQATDDMTKNAKTCAKRVLSVKPPEFRLPESQEITYLEEGEGTSESKSATLLSGSSEDYHSLLTTTLLPNATPRLFHFSNTTGEFSCTEISTSFHHPDYACPLPFLQSDLYAASQPALFLLDTVTHLWLWQGWIEEDAAASTGARHQAERRAAIKTALEYRRRRQNSGGDCETKACLVWAGLEPKEFISFFPFWETRNDVTEIVTKSANRLPDETVDLESELKRLSCDRYPLATLLERPLPDGVDPTQLEFYLDPHAFNDAFAMTRDEFFELPAWKKTSLKKEIGLF